MTVAVELLAQAAGDAAPRIGEIIRRTPLERSPAFSELAGADVYLKLENLQHTGSFKLRGATNRLLTLDRAQQRSGCVVASSGNHAAAVAYAMQRLGLHGVIFVPEKTSTAKIDAIREYGGDVRFFGIDGLDTEVYAREYAQQKGMFYLSPYNDLEVIAGQGTCGIEIAEQLPDADAVFIAVGGGGLISGVGSVLKTSSHSIRVFGCQPEASAVMAKSIQAGRILEIPSDPTLSDGTAGGIEAGAITFDLCRSLVDEFTLVSEAEIATAMRICIELHGQKIEGAAGVAIAGMLAEAERLRGQKIVVIVCGGNVSQATLDRIAAAPAG